LVVLFGALLSAIAFVSLAGASNPANSSKPYALIICGFGQTGCTSGNPAVVGPASTGTAAFPPASVTFKNDVSQGNTNIPLGSDNLNVPTALPHFSVVGVLQALPNGTTQPLSGCPQKLSNTGPTCWYSLKNGSTVGFRNLDLGPGQSVTFPLQLVTPPPSTTVGGPCTAASPCPWTDEAKQSNDFSGTGNDLNADGSSAYGTVLGAVESCPKNQKCPPMTLANGGTASDAGGSITVTIQTSSGKNSVTQIESLDYGTPLASGPCSGVSSVNYEYDKLSSGGSDRAQTVTITTTTEGLLPGQYVQEVCNADNKPFTAKVIDPNTGAVTLAPAVATTLPDGTAGFQGLLPDCGTKPLASNQVDCTKNPGVERGLSSPPDSTPTSTTVVAIPAGFDGFRGN
jgi:hypothetical protein